MIYRNDLLRAEIYPDSTNEPRGTVPIFAATDVSLMLLIALVVAVVSLVIGGFMYRFPSRSGNWSNVWVENRLPGKPCFFVGAYHIHGWEPTVGYFVRYDRIEDSQTNPPTKWLEDRAGGRVFVNSREVFHRPGTFQLFVDDGRGQPVRILLDRADARHYFGSDNVVFVNYEGFADFWDDVLMTKYREHLRDQTR